MTKYPIQTGERECPIVQRLVEELHRRRDEVYSKVRNEVMIGVCNMLIDAIQNARKPKRGPREWWIITEHGSEFDLHAFSDLERAKDFNKGFHGSEPVHVREVL